MKFVLQDGDEEMGFNRLTMELREQFDDFDPLIVEFENIEEQVAMDIFVKLQGGKSLNKAEIRAALGGLLCDFVTELTYGAKVVDEGEDFEEQPSKHPFFKEISLRNTRKAHRTLADVLLHEFLYPGTNKHWTSLEKMYLDNAKSLTAKEKRGFLSSLGKFQKQIQFEENGEKKLLPQLRSTFLILSFFRAWRELSEHYALPDGFDFAESVKEFERLRQDNDQELPWLAFTAALSNAGYSQNRIEIVELLSKLHR